MSEILKEMSSTDALHTRLKLLLRTVTVPSSICLLDNKNTSVNIFRLDDLKNTSSPCYAVRWWEAIFYRLSLKLLRNSFRRKTKRGSKSASQRSILINNSAWNALVWVLDVALIFKSTSSWWLATWAASHDFQSFYLTSLAPYASLELMKKCFQHQFLILLSVICYSAALCSLARALFNPFNVHPSFVIFLITASHNIHSCNALLSFLIIYIHKMCTINPKKKKECKARNDLSDLAEKESFSLATNFAFIIKRARPARRHSSDFYVSLICLPCCIFVQTFLHLLPDIITQKKMHG